MASNSAKTVLFPSMTFPPILFFAYLAQNFSLAIEACENYQKRSLRNRYYLPGPNGAQPMSIPLAGGKNNRCPIRDVAISFDEDWTGIHLKSIQAFYGKSAFFNYYIDDLRQIFTTPEKTLWEFNQQCLNFCLKTLQIDATISITRDYEANHPGTDFRKAKIPDFCINTKHLYTQLYQERNHEDKVPVSILDLIFCLGPEAVTILRQIDTP